MTTPLRILVADDSPTVRDAVVAMLTALDGARITTVENGAQALREACQGEYSLLICDLEMPVLNGSQLLRMLRTQFFSSDELPIIMLTQFGEPEQKVRAFADGANDYVTKPVEPQELLARARAQIELRELHRQTLSSQALSLHTQKLTAVAQLSATLAHELNTPAQFMSDNLTFLSQALKQLAPHLSELPAELGYLREEIPRSLEDMADGVYRIASIVQAIREFAEADAERVINLDVRNTLNSVVDLLRSRWLGAIDLRVEHAPDVRCVRCGPADLKHALWQLIAQAIDDATHQGDHPKGRVEIETSRDAKHVSIVVRGSARRPGPGGMSLVPRTDPIVLMRAVMHKYGAELTREASSDGFVTATLRLPV